MNVVSRSRTLAGRLIPINLLLAACLPGSKVMLHLQTPDHCAVVQTLSRLLLHIYECDLVRLIREDRRLLIAVHF